MHRRRRRRRRRFLFVFPFLFHTFKLAFISGPARKLRLEVPTVALMPCEMGALVFLWKRGRFNLRNLGRVKLKKDEREEGKKKQKGDMRFSRFSQTTLAHFRGQRERGDKREGALKDPHDYRENWSRR